MKSIYLILLLSFCIVFQSYSQTVSDSIQPVETISYKNCHLKIKVVEDKSTIIATVQSSDNQLFSGVEVGFFVKRMFGNLLIGTKKTNANGVASVEFPKDLPSDSLGNVEVIVKLVDEKKFGKVAINQVAKLGKLTQPKNILAERAMWGTRAKAPLWILFSYLGVTGGVWLVIGYVVLNLFKIKRLGKKPKNKIKM